MIVAEMLGNKDCLLCKLATGLAVLVSGESDWPKTWGQDTILISPLPGLYCP